MADAFSEETWRDDLLVRLHAPLTPDTRAAVLAWMHAEGGHWHNTAKYNPLNTSYEGHGGTSAGTSQKSIKKYPTYEAGMRATVDTLLVSRFAPQYAPIVAALKANDGQAAITAIASSPWGTKLPVLQKRYDELRGRTVARANVIGGPVVAWAQALADAIQTRWPDVGHISTYEGHDPDRRHALDVFPRDRAQGDQIAEWATSDEVIDKYGIDYHIWWTQIWNREIARHWRPQRTTGNVTKDHKDHLHFSVNTTFAGDISNEEDDELTGEEKAQLRYVKDAIDEVKSMIEGLAHGDEGGRDAWENGRRRFVMIQKAADERSEEFMVKLDELLARTKAKG